MATNAAHSLADKIPGLLGTRAAYGDPVQLGDTTLIPVAYTVFGFGAGEGSGEATSKNAAKGEGDGGGAGGLSIPIGAYVHCDDEVYFEPNLIALLAVSVPVIFVLGRALSRIIRALKK